jgi:hypothetical protein
MKTPLQIRSYEDTLFRDKISLNHTVLSTNDSISLMATARDNARKLCASAFSNLEEFPYLYFTSGITESIDFLLTQREFYARVNEYRYIFAHKTVSPKNSGVAEYRSYPFSATGAFDDIPTTREVILDCAYMFASNMNHHVKKLPDNVSHVMFGLSKSHNLADLRIGWFFSKKQYLGFHTLQYLYGYASSIAASALSIAVEYSPNELYKRNSTILREKFINRNIIENDTNLFGISDTGEKIPYYAL